MISLVAAVAAHRVIGNQGRLPWRLPADLARFKRLTTGHAVLMGRKTFQSIGRPLPGRRNIVLSRDPDFSAAGCQIARSVGDSLTASGLSVDGGGELFVIGGASTYELFLPLADRLYVTRIAAEVPGDAFFPALDEKAWQLVEKTPGTVDAANPLPHEFLVYERKQE
ncbi:MAG: dihydrofolate reductase [Spirochaetes bacterium]|nr:dihydrofolate reductase [Spirochaetota bacterium]